MEGEKPTAEATISTGANGLVVAMRHEYIALFPVSDLSIIKQNSNMAIGRGNFRGALHVS